MAVLTEKSHIKRPLRPVYTSWSIERVPPRGIRNAFGTNIPVQVSHGASIRSATSFRGGGRRVRAPLQRQGLVVAGYRVAGKSDATVAKNV